MIAFFHAQGMQKRGYDVTIFTTTQDTSVPLGWSEYMGLKIYTFYTSYSIHWWGYKSVYNGQVVKQFAKEIVKLQPDIVHFHNIQNYFSYAVIGVAKRLSNAKLFLTAHDTMSVAYNKLFVRDGDYHISFWQQLKAAKKRFNPLRGVYIRHYFRKLDKIIAVSDALGKALMSNGIGPAQTIHNGIDVERFQNPGDVNALRHKLGLEVMRVVLFAGRFTPSKGSEVLLEAMQKVVAAIPGVRLLVVGVTPDDGIRHELVRFGMEPYTLLQANMSYDEMPAVYGIAEVVVVPSLYLDPFPTVNMEAMAAKRPVVTTCFGGSPEVVIDGVTGCIIDPHNIDVLVSSIEGLLQDKQKGEMMGQKGNERVAKYFTREQFLDAYEALY